MSRVSSEPGMTWPPSSDAPESFTPISSSCSFEPTTWKFLNVKRAGRPLYEQLPAMPPDLVTTRIAMSRLSGSM